MANPFRFASRRIVIWPVRFKLPEDGKRYREYEIDIHYIPLTRAEMRELLRKNINESADVSILDRLRIQVDEARAEEYIATLVDHITGWGRVEGDDGAPLEFSERNLRALLDAAIVGSAIDVGLWEVSREAPEKNSSPGRAG